MKQRLAIAIGLAMIMGWGGSSPVMAQSASAVTQQTIDTQQRQLDQDQRADQGDEASRQREIRAEEEAELPESQLPPPGVRRHEPGLFDDHQDVSHDPDDLHRISR